MRYPDGGGLFAEGRGRREKLRLQAAQMFERGIRPVRLARVAALIARLFHVIRYTLRGTSYLLHRIGFTPQVPMRRAVERDEAAIAACRATTWAKVQGLAAATGAWICFEDEAGQNLRPLKVRTWARRGRTPVVTVSGKGSGRVSVAGLVCLRPVGRGHLFYRVRIHRGRKGERRSMSEAAYAGLIALGNLAARNVDQLAAIVKNRVKKIQYRPAHIDGFIAQTGLTLEPQPRDGLPNAPRRLAAWPAGRGRPSGCGRRG
jgi:Winged helix-turn helix